MAVALQPPPPPPPIKFAAIVEFDVPTSAEGEEISNHVRQPIQHRTPVGYDRGFLEAYRPNETSHLPPEVRTHLNHIGRGAGSSMSAAQCFTPWPSRSRSKPASA